MRFLFSAIILLSLCGASCAGPANYWAPAHEEVPAVYYWKTALRLDSAERAIMKRHAVGRVYLRMFDVVPDHSATSADERAVPNASVRVDDEIYELLRDSLDSVEFVPVVYITLETLKAMEGYEGNLAANIVERVSNMCSYNGLPRVSELQLDCDWTTSTEPSFFRLCDSVRARIRGHELPWCISSTIRLHQLRRKVPPVDRGVLMVYNTGSFNNPDAANSIIDADDVKPYLPYLPDYPLHLDVAYPTYSWQLLFRGRKFVGLTRGLALDDSTRFSPTGVDRFIARRDMPHGNGIIHAGDMVRWEQSDIAYLLHVKHMIERQMAGRPHSNILYHLDNDNLSKYTSDEIERILSTGH